MKGFVVLYKKKFMIRFFDILFSLFGLLFGLPLLVLIFLVSLFDTGSPLLCQKRIGRNRKPFVLLKFRSMRLKTPTVATHLVDSSAITFVGGFLRRTKLDELPQLFNVLKGDMSLVGPRPCLCNQNNLIVERTLRGVFEVRPGMTGLAQVSGIDMSTPQLLAEVDAIMLKNLNIKNYFKYIFKTVWYTVSGDRVKLF